MPQSTPDRRDLPRYTPTWLTIPIVLASLVFITCLMAQFALNWQFGTRPAGAAGFPFLYALAGSAVAFAVGLLLSAIIIGPVTRLAAAAGRRTGTGTERPGSPVKSFGDALTIVSESVDAHHLGSCTLDSLESAVVTMGPDGTVTSFNAAAERLTGRPAGETIGGHYSLALGSRPECCAASGSATLQDLIRDGLESARTCSSEDTTLHTLDGRALGVGVTISLLNDGGSSPGLVAIFKNLTQINEVRRQVRRAEDLASLGALSAGIAHEIRNPLGALRGLTELLERDLPADSPNRSYTRTIIKSLDHLNSLVEDLLSFGQPSVSQLQSADPHELLAAAVEFVRYASGRQIELRESAGELPSVAVDPERIQQALANLLRNAIDAAGEDGAIDVGARVLGDEVLLDVHNTNSYIPPERRDRIFQPFISTKPGGTGLGLPISHQIVRAHGGGIMVDSHPGTGTTFSLCLPAVPTDLHLPMEAAACHTGY